MRAVHTSFVARVKKAWRRLTKETYELSGTEIVAYQAGREAARVSVDQITTWTAYPEMTCDYVVLQIVGGGELVWHDTFNDLLAILREHVAEREVQP